MEIDTQRKIDRHIGIPLCKLLSLIPAGSKRHESKAPKNILIILLSEMGSLVLAYPMFTYLKKTYPQAALHVMLFAKNREIIEALDIVPQANIIPIRSDSMIHMAADSLKALYKMRKTPIDTVLDCELFSRISSIYSRLSGAANRCGFHPHRQEGLYRGDFINRPLLYNPYLHISDQFVNLARTLEADQMPLIKNKMDREIRQAPQIKTDTAEREKWLRQFRTDFPQAMMEKLVLLYPGGGLLPIRAWPIENYCLVAQNLIENGYTVAIIGLSEDKALAGRITDLCNHEKCLDLTGYTKTIRELFILFQHAALLVTNDGGPGHFASMTPLPAIIFFGPETPTLYGSLAPNAVNLHEQIACSPCLTAYNHRNSPCDGNNTCLQLIDPQQVLKQAYAILNGDTDAET